jgi:hypothetical protein
LFLLLSFIIGQRRRHPVSADMTESRLLLQMHNGGFRQCCHAASAYALLTYFRASSLMKWQNGQATLPFAAKVTSVAVERGSMRTKRDRRA